MGYSDLEIRAATQHWLGETCSACLAGSSAKKRVKQKRQKNSRCQVGAESTVLVRGLGDTHWGPPEIFRETLQRKGAENSVIFGGVNLRSIFIG